MLIMLGMSAFAYFQVCGNQMDEAPRNHPRRGKAPAVRRFPCKQGIFYGIT
jgi:hypothetical protein